MTEEEITRSKEYEASFNLALHLTEEIANCLARADEYYSRDNMIGYFNNLVIIRRRINSFISEEEKEVMNNLESQIDKTIGSTGTPFETPKPIHLAIMNKTKGICKNILKEYDSKIMFLLRKYGLLIPPKKDKSVLIG